VLCLYCLGNDAVREKFTQMKDGHIRVVVVAIENGFY
jgi:hypothetical protein